MRFKATSVLLAICLALLLSSCSQRSQQVPKSVVLLPPETVFTPCEHPVLKGETWWDAASYTLALQSALRICAGQVYVLSQWRSATGI
ncbi:hypothetical protein D3C75_1064710 [compost metagenome]